MNGRNNNEEGFSGVELLIVLVTVMLLGMTGWLVYRHHSSSSSSTTHHGQISPKAGWFIYRSIHSSVEFQYPAAWKLAKNLVQSDDKYTLEDLSITGTNGFTLNFSLNKTNHNPVIYNADCVAPPKITVLDSLNNKLVISYSTYNDIVNGLWLGSLGNTVKGYGYATGQCRERGVDYVSLPNDEYATLDGSYVSSNYSQYRNLKTSDFLNKPEVKNAIDVLRSFSY